MPISPVSVTGIGAIIVVIEYLFGLFGVEFPEGSVEAGVQGGIAFVGLVLVVIGQLRRKDLKAGLLRKTPKKS